MGMVFTVFFGMGSFLQGILIILFFAGVFGDIIGLYKKFQGFGIDAPFTGKFIDEAFDTAIDSFMQGIDEVLVHEVSWLILIFVPHVIQYLGSGRIRLAEAQDFFVDFLDDFLVLP